MTIEELLTATKDLEPSTESIEELKEALESASTEPTLTHEFLNRSYTL